ncbi:MAG: molybdopterin-dependent oxidoreductase [Deltaproteobacteria bacterium]|nr:molybdopterin-dependent oxidoreductase [Deltaproteobacteria bacterium]
MPDLTRRELLAAGTAATAVLALRSLAPSAAILPGATTAHATMPVYTGVADLYRKAWRWDRVVRGTHLRANCFSACSFDLFVKDGMVWREEQADVYEREAPGLSDYAPRGCQKGACYSAAMIGPDRITHPLERVGPRGSGRWRRISWERALTRLADGILDATLENGAETVVFDNGTSNVDDGPDSLGEMRLFSLLGATLLDGFGGTGDLAMGAFQTWGTSFVDGSSDDWMRADTLIFWHCNPVSTRIPDFHFATEARYKGAYVITVAPDYSPTAIHASLWLNPRPASDAALALGVARSIVERGAVDEAYVREQTDLPLLVCDDTKRFLRQSDLEDGGNDDIFYVWDLAAGGIAEAPGSQGFRGDSLALGDLRPALAGRFEVTARGGRRAVRPVMEHLRERLAEYTPEYVESITGVAPGLQAQLAERLAASRRTLIYASWGSNKQYHADLLQRSLILLAALRGHHGRAGGGVRFAAWLPLEGGSGMIPGGEPSWFQRQILRFYTPPPRTIEDAIAAASKGGMTWTPSHLFLHTHAGLDRLQDADAQDAALPRPARAYLDEALERGWLKLRPAREHPPRVLVTSGVNPLRRWPAPQVVEEVLWPKLKLIAVIDFRMSITALKADLVLPAAGYYEKRGIKYVVALSPYVVVGDRAVEPLGESKNEWKIMSLLAQRLQERARARGIEGPLANFHERFTDKGRYGLDSEPEILDHILRESAATRGIGWEEARRAGALPMKSAGSWGTTSGVGSEIEGVGTLTPSRVHVDDRHAWPTLTGRQQFYLDHPWFLEGDEALPRWKPLPRPGGSHPILLSGGHTRWSIHAIWRNHPDLLRLQRGGPAIWMSVEDATERGIRDGEQVHVWNDHGAFEVAAKVAAALGPGQALIYHAWEPYQFPGWRGNMEVVSSPYKPLHFAGGYGHLRNRIFCAGPVHVPRGIPVEIEKAETVSA